MCSFAADEKFQEMIPSSAKLLVWCGYFCVDFNMAYFFCLWCGISYLGAMSFCITRCVVVVYVIMGRVACCESSAEVALLENTVQFRRDVTFFS